MIRLPKILIQVPGTSANLGPGFDLMGLALDLRNEFEFTFSKEITESKTELKNGNPLPFTEKEDLVYQSYLSYFKKFEPSITPPPYHCKMVLSLPLKGGLGSSASAIVAGLSLAREIHKRLEPKSVPSEPDFLQYLAEFEGHPDNTLPAYLGGFVFAYSTFGEKLKYFRKKFPSSVAIFVLTPEFHVSTEESRKSLPKSYATADVIFNLSRIGAWMHFLDKRKFGDLLVGLEDKMHTPYRIPKSSPLFPLAETLTQAGIGYCLSGSGPSLLVFLERKSVKSKQSDLEEKISNVMGEAKISYSFKRVKPDGLGVRIQFK
ncbi:homoserine kinase [Leptospira bandrabouensis]|uniref:Homoserine kinase n=1 Tax=Leptospira bandrabouensis TaxID=2484903 RepID=A0A6H3NMZ2_9LEPT|nr:homoserine kinase [Leptospira bandrabouensis]MCG6142900.1 homoserine kinase [Leptospira bandrabouensis]MCG6152069.1 homoserine kinase [Leptospira bandrabouensis]MCG6162495.1 homoserine kinase [Leptospira bandrabouensis]MCW7459664.1 homoserine kinase [Leptospira bandrabouensis]MCW7477316.1 homoserine kinase [Leptospira bandrabouensis]